VRLARFEREAKTLGSLNHPNIAGVYGLENAGDIRALVMELVEGPTLADRIEQGPIPIDEAKVLDWAGEDARAGFGWTQQFEPAFGIHRTV
jgi:serine/threonine protein kinase